MIVIQDYDELLFDLDQCLKQHLGNHRHRVAIDLLQAVRLDHGRSRDDILRGNDQVSQEKSDLTIALLECDPATGRESASSQLQTSVVFPYPAGAITSVNCAGRSSKSSQPLAGNDVYRALRARALVERALKTRCLRYLDRGKGIEIAGRVAHTLFAPPHCEVMSMAKSRFAQCISIFITDTAAAANKSESVTQERSCGATVATIEPSAHR